MTERDRREIVNKYISQIKVPKPDIESYFRKMRESKELVEYVAAIADEFIERKGKLNGLDRLDRKAKR